MFYINYTQWVNSLKKGALLFIASLIDRRETCNSDQQGLEKGKDSWIKRQREFMMKSTYVLLNPMINTSVQ